MADWYFGEQGQQIGPLDDAAIRHAIQYGRVTMQTLVWREGMSQWVPLAAVPELTTTVTSISPYASPGYPGQMMPYGPGMMESRSSGLAVASMVSGIIGIVVCPFFGSIPAVICGHMALSQINQSPMPMSGRGMAIAGLVMGYLPIAIIAISMVMLVVSQMFR